MSAIQPSHCCSHKMMLPVNNPQRYVWIAVILSFQHIWDFLMKSPQQLQPTGQAGNKDRLKALGLTSEDGDSGEREPEGCGQCRKAPYPKWRYQLW